MKNDSVLRNRYLDQYKDIYGENIYLSSIELVENRISTIKGGSELTAFYHLVKDCKDLPGGIYTPASSMGEKLIKRLERNAGLSFKVE